jgi:hypothetical protein
MYLSSFNVIEKWALESFASQTDSEHLTLLPTVKGGLTMHLSTATDCVGAAATSRPGKGSTPQNGLVFFVRVLVFSMVSMAIG